MVINAVGNHLLVTHCFGFFSSLLAVDFHVTIGLANHSKRLANPIKWTNKRLEWLGKCLANRYKGAS